MKVDQMKSVVTIEDLVRITGKSRVSIWRWERDGSIPKAIKIRGKTVGWKVEKIESWLNGDWDEFQ